MMTNLEQQWKKNGSWGMLLITDTKVFFVIEAYEDNKNWDVKQAIYLRSCHLSDSLIDIVSQFTNIEEDEAKSPMFYRIFPGNHYFNQVIPGGEVRATYPLSEKQMREVVDEQSKHGNKALNSVLSITEFTWLVRSQEEQQ